MTCFGIVLVIIAIISSVSSDNKIQLKCSSNEVQDNCPVDCEIDKCPTSENYDRTCNKPKSCPPPACKCSFNYKQNGNGTCINTWDCPPFPCTRPNEEFNPCPPICPKDTCEEATPTGTCLAFGGIFLVIECQPTCRCIPGYWRHEGVCIPYDECPTKTNR